MMSELIIADRDGLREQEFPMGQQGRSKGLRTAIDHPQQCTTFQPAGGDAGYLWGAPGMVGDC
jgi:hypothetical protein